MTPWLGDLEGRAREPVQRRVVDRTADEVGYETAQAARPEFQTAHGTSFVAARALVHKIDASNRT
ncbi:hypothetical protein [Methylobacterium sp. 285MFTsu5.1]|uniref:hypothetical protein n=1 Tax=Methylobacterium sp. 285MFTsu5.1 TaxID=1172187 RepID=UPI000367B867|nr:hypothetical protein [Methylobacterium sp. 285MFTsu5.1]